MNCAEKLLEPKWKEVVHTKPISQWILEFTLESLAPIPLAHYSIYSRFVSHYLKFDLKIPLLDLLGWVKDEIVELWSSSIVSLKQRTQSLRLRVLR